MQRISGDEWLLYGPLSYTPNVHVDVAESINAYIIKDNTALKLEAIKDCVDCNGKARKAGEKWLIKKTGAYIPGVWERVKTVVSAYILTSKEALHLVAKVSFMDVYGVQRKAGEEWLVTKEMAELHIPDV